MKEVGQRLKLALKARGIHKQMAFAAEMSVNESAVSRWQRGGGLSLANAMRVCEILDISLDWLLLGRGTMDWHRQRRAGQKADTDAMTAGLPEPIVSALTKLADAIREAARPDRI